MIFDGAAGLAQVGVGNAQFTRKRPFVVAVAGGTRGGEASLEKGDALRPVTFQVEITLGPPRDLPHRVPLLRPQRCGLHGHEVSALRVEDGKACRAAPALACGQRRIVQRQAANHPGCGRGLRAGIGVRQGVRDLVVVVRAQEEAVVDQFAQGATGGGRGDVEGGGHRFVVERSEGQHAGHAKGGLRRGAHLPQTARQQQGYALAGAVGEMQCSEARFLQPGHVLARPLPPLEQVAAHQKQGQGQTAQQPHDLVGGLIAGGVGAGPGAQQGEAFGGRQGSHILDLSRRVGVAAAGDEHAATAGHLEHSRQVVGGFGPVENQQGLAVGKGQARGVLRAGARVDAAGASDRFQRQAGLRLVVEGVKDDAAGETGRRVGVGGETPDGLGGQRGLAHAAGAAEGEDAPRLQLRQQLRQLRLTASEVLRAQGPLQRERAAAFAARHVAAGQVTDRRGQPLTLAQGGGDGGQVHVMRALGEQLVEQLLLAPAKPSPQQQFVDLHGQVVVADDGLEVHIEPQAHKLLQAGAVKVGDNSLLGAFKQGAGQGHGGLEVRVQAGN